MSLTGSQIQEKLDAIRGWVFIDGKIQKTYSFSDFMKAMEYINKLAIIAEHLDHHPDIHVRYNKVTIATSSHDEDGITDKDFKLAKECEQLAVDMI